MPLAAKTKTQLETKIRAAGPSSQIITLVNTPATGGTLDEKAKRHLRDHMGRAAQSMIDAMLTTGGKTIHKSSGEDALVYHALRYFLQDDDSAKDVMAALFTVV
jgi:hypothetical protein